MKYMMIHYIDESVVPPDGEAFPGEEQELDAWDAEMEGRGILVGGGRLRPAGETVTIRKRRGEVLISDGPFTETKEQIAGYGILECASLDEAIEVSSRHPTAKFGTFELRPYWE